MKTFVKNKKAESNLVGFSIGAVVIGIIALMIFGTLTAGVMPTAIDSMNDTTGVSTGAGATWGDDLTNIWDMTTLLTVVALLAIPVAIVIKLLR